MKTICGANLLEENGERRQRIAFDEVLTFLKEKEAFFK
jgi:hypothetical protein